MLPNARNVSSKEDKSSVFPFPPPHRTTEHACHHYHQVSFLVVHPARLSLSQALCPPFSETLPVYVLSALGAAPYRLIGAADGLLAYSAILGDWFPPDTMGLRAWCRWRGRRSRDARCEGKESIGPILTKGTRRSDVGRRCSCI